MRSRVLLAVLLTCATRTAFALTCGGFSVVPADHVLVNYSAALATGVTRSTPLVSVSGTVITVTRTLSGGSGTDVTCVDDTVDLGYLGAGRFNLTWNDNVNLGTQRSTFSFVVGSPASGYAEDLIDLLPPALPDRPVRLMVNSCSGNPAIAWVVGNDIYLSEYNGPKTKCNLSVLDLGILPSGIYNVTWVQSPLRLQFIVQQPAPTSACTGRSTVTQARSGTVRLHFEEAFHGYTPVFGPPTVTVMDQYPPASTVIQPVADTANAYTSGAPSYSTVCHAEELDLGPLADGYHEVWWWDQINVNGLQSYSGGAVFGFRLQNGRTQCTSDPELLTPYAVEGAPFDAAINIAALAWQWGAVKGTANGHTITVDIPTFFEGPGDALPLCQTYRASIAPLPAGDYTLVWRLSGTRQELTTHFTVVKPARRRGARH